MKRLLLVCLLMLLVARNSAAQPVETELAGVTAEFLELRQHDGVLRLAIRFVNTTATPVAADGPLLFNEVTLVDAKARVKYLGLKDGEGHFLAGPMTDQGSAGRWWINLAPKADAILWMLFPPLPSGTVVSVHVPRMFPFESVAVVEGSPSKAFSSTAARSTPSGLMANLVSATRMKTGEVRVRLRIERTGTFEPIGFLYKDFMLYDPATRSLHPLLKGDDGLFLAQPRTDAGSGGRFWPNAVGPKSPALMSLTFGGVPQTLKTIDLLMPWFVPMTGVEIVNETDTKR